MTRTRIVVPTTAPELSVPRFDDEATIITARPVVPIAPSDNGGDKGWGNCGHNSGGGNPPSDGGNGGYSKDDCATAVPTDPPTDPPPNN